MKKAYLSFTLIPLLIIMASCSKPGNNDSNRNSNQEKAVTVLVQEVQPEDLEQYVRISGKLEGISDVTVVSEISGKIAKINKNLGDWINAGESIGQIDNSNYVNQFDQAEANLMASESNYETANIQMQVSEKLYKDNKISESEYLLTRSALKSAEAALKGSAANRDNARKMLANSQFSAPVSGYISELNLKLGEFISLGSVVANIVNNQNLIIRTGVGESDISYIKKGNKVIIGYNDREYIAYVTGVGIKPVTGGNNYPIEIQMENPDRDLLPGMVVEGNIHTRTYENVINTSIENLREKYDQKFVYVINSEKRAEIRYVEIGEKIANNVIITSGLIKGDKLVIDGIDSLTEGSLVDIKSGF
jgi:RND family efflux transporter MFP subunit